MATDLFYIKTPMRRKPIGKAHDTIEAAIDAAKRAAKRLDSHINIKHWQEDGIRYTVFSDGNILKREV